MTLFQTYVAMCVCLSIYLSTYFTIFCFFNENNFAHDLPHNENLRTVTISAYPAMAASIITFSYYFLGLGQHSTNAKNKLNKWILNSWSLQICTANLSVHSLVLNPMHPSSSPRQGYRPERDHLHSAMEPNTGGQHQRWNSQSTYTTVISKQFVSCCVFKTKLLKYHFDYNY